MSAIISDCGQYRYRLDRKVVGAGNDWTAVIMVNPSTADATDDDATIRKILGFATRHKWGKIIVGNLFAYRATDIKTLARVDDPVGPANNTHLLDMIIQADRVVVGWGTISKLPPTLRGRWREVMNLIDRGGPAPVCIGEPCGDGHPRHPLMPGYDTPILPWENPDHRGL